MKHFKHDQRGATLFIGLLLLLAISIVSLAAMRTSILDLVIANNKQQFLNSFEAAENTLKNTLANSRLTVTGTEQRGDILFASQNPEIITAENAMGTDVNIAEVVTEIRYQNQGTALGWELNGTAYHFVLDAEAESTGRGTNANHRTGFYIVAPGTD